MSILPNARRFFINGAWCEPHGGDTAPLTSPFTEEEIGRVALGDERDVDDAVAAARSAFFSFSQSSRSERLELLKAINEQLIERNDDIADAVHQTMGAPLPLARSAHAESGPQHFGEMIRVLESYEFETPMGSTIIRREPIGVCVLITPWNWPVNQVATKLAPAIAAGCAVVLKPSEYTPLDSLILAEICSDVGVPAGVFNLVNGTGQGVGMSLCSHPDVDFISFTGSTRAGIAIGQAAARSVKRVALELGGKSACIFLDDADIESAVPAAVRGVMVNSGQSCNASARFLVPRSSYDQVCALAGSTAQALVLGPDGEVGPLANAIQFDRVRRYINLGLSEGGRLMAGGVDRPDDFPKGYYVLPTVLADIVPGSTVEREEIFGPVVTITIYDSVEDAIEIANNSEYGLSGAVWGRDHANACSVAAALRTGMVHVNGAGLDSAAPFGGYKKSGNGREWGRFGFEEFLEVKSVYGGVAP